MSLFRAISENIPFIQILNIDRSHWIVVSNMPFNINSDSVFIYDSLLMTISDSLVNMVCSFFKCSSMDHLNFGVFSIAFATECIWCCTWNTVMRSHLLQAFELKDLKARPTCYSSRKKVVQDPANRDLSHAK